MPIKIEANASGTGIFTITNPNSASARGITLPDADTTLVGTDTAQTLTNKTIQGSTVQGGALSFGTAVASTSGTLIDFTGIPSWVKRITVLLSGVSTSGTSFIRVQIGSTTVQTTGYAGGGAITGGANISTGGTTTTGFDVVASANVADTRHTTMVITNVNGNTWLMSYFGSLSNAAFATVGGGSVTLSGTLDRVRVTTVNGTDTFDAGIINIMYEG